MKAYIAIKYHPDHSNRDRIALISAALESQGFETICIARDLEQWGQVKFDAPTLMLRTFDVINTCDFVIVDLTEKGVGLGIEAGYAFAQHIPVVTIAQVGSDISATLRGISAGISLYQDFQDLVEFFKDFQWQ